MDKFVPGWPYGSLILMVPQWYHGARFGMAEVERLQRPVPTVILERDGTRIGCSMNGAA